MNRSKLLYSLLILVSVGVGISIAGDGIKPQYKPTERAAYLSQALETVFQPGLNITIQQVTFAPPAMSVTFQLTDGNKQGLDRLGIATPGPISTSFMIARIRPGDTQYTAYFTNHVTALAAPGCANCTVGNAVDQPATDSGGTYQDLGNGTYKYTFGKQLPASVDMNSTTTLVVYGRRDLSAFGTPLNSLGTIANTVYDFVPSGAAVTQVRDVVTTAACNQCHNPLALHGGTRQEVRLCVLCHQPQNSDPESGNTVDFKVFIHKIHMGTNLPSVSGKPLDILGPSGGASEGGVANPAIPGPAEEDFKPAKPYQIVGFSQSLNDYSTVVWPQDVRNCTTCHQGGKQSDNWKNNPSRAACGSCHDDVDFTTGKNHAGGAQSNDTQCSICHVADTGNEFDASVAGAHTIPAFSKNLPGVQIKILQVTNTTPGSKPTVSFSLTDNAGNPLDASKMNSLSLRLTGPTTDYTVRGNLNGEDARSATAGSAGTYTYTFKTASIPADAKGTFVIGAEGYRQVNIPGILTGQAFPVRDAATNPLVYFNVNGGTAAPRRKVVDRNNCNVCHKSLGAHGGTRNNPDYCVTCHTPTEIDNPDGSRAAGFPVPAGIAPTSINFRFMIHRIHTGEELDREYTVYRTRGIFGFNGVRFPADRRDCAKCHVKNSNQLPLPAGLAKTTAPREFYTPLGPAASACLGCHDAVDAAAHAYLQTAPFGESCPVCHEEGAEFAVSKVHAR